MKKRGREGERVKRKKSAKKIETEIIKKMEAMNLREEERSRFCFIVTHYCILHTLYCIGWFLCRPPNIGPHPM